MPVSGLRSRSGLLTSKARFINLSIELVDRKTFGRTQIARTQPTEIDNELLEYDAGIDHPDLEGMIPRLRDAQCSLDGTDAVSYALLPVPVRVVLQRLSPRSEEHTSQLQSL